MHVCAYMWILHIFLHNAYVFFCYVMHHNIAIKSYTHFFKVKIANNNLEMEGKYENMVGGVVVEQLLHCNGCCSHLCSNT